MQRRRGAARRGRAVWAAVSILMAGACVAPAGRVVGGPVPAVRERGIVLQVKNRGWTDVAVYLDEGGPPLRLGMVESMHDDRLLIRAPSPARPVRLVLRPIGSLERVALDPIWVQPGGALELLVHPVPGMSSLSAW